MLSFVDKFYIGFGNILLESLEVYEHVMGLHLLST